MIYFILARNNSETIKKYLGYRGKQLADRIGIIYYDNLKKLKNISASTLIFSDFDRFSPDQLEELKSLFNEIKTKYPRLNLVNDPNKVKLRYDLLKQLYKDGINGFNIFRLTESLDAIKYPVFLREENNHTGTLSNLIYDVRSLEQNLLALNLQGYPAKNLSIVEYVDVSVNGNLYKKYSALKVKDQIYPRQLDYDLKWMVKGHTTYSQYPVEEYLNDYENYMNENPHRDWLEHIFNIAGIEYGRIDYGVLDGKPIVWEINLNPNYGNFRKKSGVKLNETVDRIRHNFHKQLTEKFLELDQIGDVEIKLDISEQTLHKLEPEKWVEFWRKFHDLYKTKKSFLIRMVNFIRQAFLVLARILLFFLKPFGYSPIPKK